MKIQPLDSYHSPQIPTRDYVDYNPEILNHIPRRWMTDAVVLTALAGTVMLLSSCKSNTGPNKTPNLKVAPVFKHGEGLGAFGCVMVTPPVFLSEVEARDVIRQEALKAGIAFDLTHNPVIEVPVPRYSKLLKRRFGVRFHPVYIDGINKKRHIYYKYISVDDSLKLEPDEPVTYSVSSTNAKQNAESLRNTLNTSSQTGVYGIFYDPVTDVPVCNYGKYSKFPKSQRYQLIENEKLKNELKAKTESKKLLRAQVQDFIKWLKTEGII